MNLFVFLKEVAPNVNKKPHELYNLLMAMDQKHGFKIEDKGENMAVASLSIGMYQKPLFLLNHSTQCAYQFMDTDEKLCMISDNNIDWKSLKGLSDDCLRRAHNRDAHFPTQIRGFENGVAEVSWQLNPDGRYYMDEDGYGMTDDEEVEIYGFIDRQGRLVVKFENINGNWSRLCAMRRKAQKLAKK